MKRLKEYRTKSIKVCVCHRVSRPGGYGTLVTDNQHTRISVWKVGEEFPDRF